MADIRYSRPTSPLSSAGRPPPLPKRLPKPLPPQQNHKRIIQMNHIPLPPHMSWLLRPWFSKARSPGSTPLLPIRLGSIAIMSNLLPPLPPLPSWLKTYVRSIEIYIYTNYGQYQPHHKSINTGTAMKSIVSQRFLYIFPIYSQHFPTFHALLEIGNHVVYRTLGLVDL